SSDQGDIAGWLRAGPGLLQVHLHAPGSAAFTPASLLDIEGTALLVDLPGHGASCETDAVLDVVTMVAGIASLIDTVTADALLSLHAHGAAAAYLPGLAKHFGARLQTAHLHAPWLLTVDEQ